MVLLLLSGDASPEVRGGKGDEDTWSTLPAAGECGSVSEMLWVGAWCRGCLMLV